MRSQQVLEPQRMSSMPIVSLRTFSRQASAPITSTPGCSQAAPSCPKLLQSAGCAHRSATSDLDIMPFELDE